MADNVTLDDSARGNRVISAAGEEVGVVTDVQRDVLYVDPSPGVADQLLSRLGWNAVGQGDYQLEMDAIKRVTDDEVHLVDFD